MESLDNTIADSRIQGLAYIGDPQDGSLSISSFSLGAGAASSVRTISVVADGSPQEAATMTKIRFSGVGNTTVDNKWLQVQGAVEFSNTSYSVAAIIERTNTGASILIQFLNNTGGSVTIPDIEVSTRTYFYLAPW